MAERWGDEAAVRLLLRGRGAIAPPALCPEERFEIVDSLHEYRPPGDPVMLARSFGITLLHVPLPGDNVWLWGDGVGFYDRRGDRKMAPWYAFAACLLNRALPLGGFTGGDVAITALDMTYPPHLLRGDLDDLCRRQPYAPRWVHELRRSVHGVGSGQIARVG